MYQHFYRLRELPFELTPNPKYLFLTGRHREALSNLQYGLLSARAITVLIGEAGTGKTTLLNVALESTACRNVSCVYLNNPALTRTEFVEILSRRFELSPLARGSKAVLLEELEAVLRERRSRGQISALVIDEAQSLSAELLEEVRLLANSETATDKLLPLVLAGQPELKDRLNEPGLRQLKQRVALRCEILPFTNHETASYIAARIATAGGDATKIFTREAVLLIHEKSGGIPRVVSVICDNALLNGFARGQQTIDREIVLEVARDFDLGLGSVAEPKASETDDAGETADPDSQPLATVTNIAFAVPGPETIPEDRVVAERELFTAVKPRRFSFFGSRRGSEIE
jgi:type II secretory pathway predicted ATPase ExeA